MYKHVFKPIELLKPYENNPRVHSDKQVDQIISSIQEFGFTNPVLIDQQDRIIAGHGRVLAAKKMGLASVPCILLEGLTQEQLRAYVIADNRLAENASWDMDLLTSEIIALEELDIDLSLLGFDDAELKALMGTDEIEVFEPKLQDEERAITENKSLAITVICKDFDEQQDLFLELRDRGYRVKI